MDIVDQLQDAHDSLLGQAYDRSVFLAALTEIQRLRGDGARLSASEVACYRWPEDTAEHRAMRAAFMDGAAHVAPRDT